MDDGFVTVKRLVCKNDDIVKDEEMWIIMIMMMMVMTWIDLD